MEVRILNYGGIVTHLMVPNKEGNVEDVVLGYDNLEGYLESSPYFGALVGRYGNRIANGQFELDGQQYTLATNNNENHLHGGIKGFDKVIWDAEIEKGTEETKLKLSYQSKDMEEGYPGNLAVTVTYRIKRNNEIQIDYEANTDKMTIINLTQHSYFNLSGNAKRDILDHVTTIKSPKIVPVDKSLIPTGGFMPVYNTPFDFNSGKKVGARINDDHEQIRLGLGYDHCYVVADSSNSSPAWIVKVLDEETGRIFELATTEPGVQFYSGNFLDGSITGKYGVVYQQRYGICFEPEHFPDSPNQPQFPSTVLEPEETYRTTTIWKFSTL